MFRFPFSWFLHSNKTAVSEHFRLPEKCNLSKLEVAVLNQYSFEEADLQHPLSMWNVDRAANAGADSLEKCAAGIDAKTEYTFPADLSLMQESSVLTLLKNNT